MRPVLLYVMFWFSVMWCVGGSRLSKLEDQVNDLKTFIYTELGYIRVEVKEIANRVEILENITVAQEPNIPNIDIQVGPKHGHGENNKAGQVITAAVKNINKAFKNEKQDLHKLKTDVHGQLRDMEKKIDTHLESLTSEVQENIKNIRKNTSLANANFLDVMKESIANVSKFSVNLRKEISGFAANTSEQFSLRFNETEDKIKENISSTYHHNEDKLKSFMALADRNISQHILKADNIIRFIRTNFSEMPTQITNLSLELDSVKQKVHFAEVKLKQIIPYLQCNKVEDGYYYPCEAIDIRLASASPYRSTGVQGRLEIRHNNIWGTACDDSFEHGRMGATHVRNNVNVVCAMFGFGECDFVLEAGLGQGSGPILMDEVKCDGRESSFMDCPHSGWGSHDCGHEEDVGIRMWN